MILTRFGKIHSVKFGLGGYQDVCIGIHFTLGGEGWGAGDSRSAWDSNIVQVDSFTKWTEAGRSKQYDEIVRYVSDLLHAAKVDSIDELKGIPVEAAFDGNLLKEWRILTEVL